MELQRHAMLMYTSCGWFFDELSGIETVQVIQYAGRVVQLAEQLFGDAIEQQFLESARAGEKQPPGIRRWRKHLSGVTSSPPSSIWKRWARITPSALCLRPTANGPNFLLYGQAPRLSHRRRRQTAHGSRPGELHVQGHPGMRECSLSGWFTSAITTLRAASRRRDESAELSGHARPLSATLSLASIFRK